MSLWSWIKSLFGGRKQPERPLISVVLLLREPRYLNEEILRVAVRNALEVDLSDRGPESTEFIVGGEDMPTNFVNLRDRALLVHNFPRPYMENAAATAEQVPELRLRRAIADHGGWLSVDWLNGPEDEDPYRTLGKLAAELLDEDCLGIFLPQFNRLYPCEPGQEELLRNPEPLKSLQAHALVPIMEVPEGDADMAAAQAEARRRWPEFVGAFERRQAEQTFAVKAPFREGENVEFMWVKVSSLENDTIYGVLDNDPMSLRKIRAGSRVTVPASDLNDWLWTDSAGMVGGFTIPTVMKSSKAAPPD